MALSCLRAAWTSDPVEAVLVRAAQDQYVQRTVARWRSQRIDLLLMPGFACPAPPRDKAADLIGTIRTIMENETGVHCSSCIDGGRVGTF